MSTHDVPGYRPEHRDVLAMGAWAEHDDGSMILVEAVEGGTAVFSIFDTAVDPPIEFRDAMPEEGFKRHFSWRPDDPAADNIQWTWHDKTPFPWERVMGNFPAGQRHASAAAQLTAAQRVARRLDIRGETIRDRPSIQRAAGKIFTGIRETISALRP